jgi:hypothetical protein
MEMCILKLRKIHTGRQSKQKLRQVHVKNAPTNATMWQRQFKNDRSILTRSIAGSTGDWFWSRRKLFNNCAMFELSRQTDRPTETKRLHFRRLSGDFAAYSLYSELHYMNKFPSKNGDAAKEREMHNFCHAQHYISFRIAGRRHQPVATG